MKYYLFALVGLGIAGFALASTTNTASLVRDPDAPALVFISDEDQTGLDITGDMTLEAWIQPHSLPNPHTGYSDVAIVGKYDAVSQKSYSLNIRYISGEFHLSFLASVDGNVEIELGKKMPTFTVGEWVHVAAVYTAALQRVELFVNSTQIASFSGTLPTSVFNSSAPVTIGLLNAEAPMRVFDGLIDDVRIWSVARNASDIALYLNTELGGDEPGLVAYWQFDNSVYDASISENHLLVNSEALFSSDVPFVGGSDPDGSGDTAAGEGPEPVSPALLVRRSDRAPVKVAIPASPAHFSGTTTAPAVSARALR